MSDPQKVSDRFFDALRDPDWRPRRSHIETARNELRDAATELKRLRAFIQSLDGKTIGIRAEGNTFIDDGIIVASDIVQPLIDGGKT